MWRGGEGLHVLTRAGGIGDGEEGGLPDRLLGEVAITEDLLRGRCTRGLGEQRGREEETAQKTLGESHRNSIPRRFDLAICFVSLFYCIRTIL